MSHLLQGCFISLLLFCLIYNPLFAFRTACAAVMRLRACLSRRLSVFLPALRPASPVFSHTVLQRSLCAILIVVMAINPVLAAPEIAQTVKNGVSAMASNSGQRMHFWWHTSGWAASFARFMREHLPTLRTTPQNPPPGWDGIEAPDQPMPRPKPQETQEARNARVVRLEILPTALSVRPGEPMPIMVFGYDVKGNPVPGVSVDLSAWNEATGEVVEGIEDEFVGNSEGSYLVEASLNGLIAETRIGVSGASISHEGQQPIGSRVVSSRDLPPAPGSSSSSSILPKTKDRIAKNLSSRQGARLASAGIKAVPRLLPIGERPDFPNSDNYHTLDDYGKTRGNPNGHPPDEGVGSSNFQFSAPILNFDGRGLGLNLALNYNSRVWHKANNEMIHNIDMDWPGPGWFLGFDKIVSMGGQNGYMLVAPDGTRRPYTCSITFYPIDQEAKCKTTDGSFIDYKVIGDSPDRGGAPRTSFVFFPNGTEYIYVSAGSNQNANYPVQIVDANSNRMLISYRDDRGPQISRISDTMGREFRFYYDGNNLPVAITAPGHGAMPRQTVVRINWQWKNLANDLGGNYGFSGVTTRVRSNDYAVISAIYYPATDTGFWFGDVDSYSKYGMINKVIEQTGMGFSAAALPADPNQPADPGIITAGTMSRQVVYDYQMGPSGLVSEPTFRRMTESWADMDVAPAVTQYLVQENANPRKVEITRPDGVKTIMYSHNSPGQFYDGMIYQDESYSPQGVFLGRSIVQWAQGECPAAGQAAGPYQYCAPRPLRVEATDERNQKTSKEFSYGPRYNQVTETREFGYGNELLRKTVNEYLNDANYNDPQPRNDLVWHHIFNLVTLTDVYGGDGTLLARTRYSYDDFKGKTGLIDTPGINYGGYEGWSPWTHPNYEVYNLDTRGNLTTIKSYANTATLDDRTAMVEVRRYDITGNVRKVEKSCSEATIFCNVTTLNYTLNTQYTWPESQTRGAASDGTRQNRTATTYDFNTGVPMTTTDANERIAQNFYFDGAPRPRFEYAPTGGYIYHHYDDERRIVYELAYEVGKSGANIASRIDKYLDGVGRVRKEIAYGKGYVFDVMDTQYDQLGRIWKQTRPYRQGSSEMPQWSTVEYDGLDRLVKTTAPDGSTVTRQYNLSSDPAGSSGQAGQTILVTDPWGQQRWACSDPFGRLVEVGEPNPDGDGTLAANGMFTRYSYNGLDLLTQVVQGDQIRLFRHDSLKRLTHQKLAEKAGTLNASGQYVGAGQWSDVFFYDTSSNLIRRVDARGVQTHYKYEDPLNRLLEVEYDKTLVPPEFSANIPTSPKVTYSYMAVGDKMRVENVLVADGMGNQNLSYDSEGRVSTVTQTFTNRANYPLVTSNLWDTLSRIKEVTYPAQYGAGEIRKKVEQTYNIAGQLDSLKFGGVSFASNPVYNAASQATSLNVGSLVKELYNFDPKTGLLTSQSVERGTDRLLDLQYNYTLLNDPNNNGAKTGQLTGIVDLRNQARNRAYKYDKLRRQKEVKGGVNAFFEPTWQQNYTFDRWGNRTSVTKTGDAPQIPLDGLASLSYNTANNRITSPGFEYDPAGNPTRAVVNDNGAQQQYRYNTAGRLAQVLSGDGTVVLASYSYGASNDRLMSVEGGVTRYFSWNEGRIEAEYEAIGANGLQWKTSYVYLGDRLLATTSGINGTDTRFHHPDRLGTRMATDAADAEEVTMQLTLPFGTIQPYGGYGGDNSWQHPTKSNPSQKRFTSYDHSETTGLHYAVNRFYSAQHGRFTQPDPIEMDAADLSDPQTLNMYAYCGNDPTNNRDPYGLFFGKLFRAIGKIFNAIKKVLLAALVAVAILVIVVVLNAPGATIAAKALYYFFAGLTKIGILKGGLLAQGLAEGAVATGIGLGITGKILVGIAAVGAIANHLQENKKQCGIKNLARAGLGLLMSRGTDKIPSDLERDYECTIMDSCKEMGLKIRDLTRGVGERRRKLDPKDPTYRGHADIWARQKGILNRCISQFKTRGCGDDDMPPGTPMSDAVHEAAHKAPKTSGLRDFINRGGLIIPAVILCTINPALCGTIIAPKPGPVPVPVPAR